MFDPGTLLSSLMAILLVGSLVYAVAWGLFWRKPQLPNFDVFSEVPRDLDIEQLSAAHAQGQCSDETLTRSVGVCFETGRPLVKDEEGRFDYLPEDGETYAGQDLVMLREEIKKMQQLVTKLRKNLEEPEPPAETPLACREDYLPEPTVIRTGPLYSEHVNRNEDIFPTGMMPFSQEAVRATFDRYWERAQVEAEKAIKERRHKQLVRQAVQAEAARVEDVQQVKRLLDLDEALPKEPLVPSPISEG